MRGGGSRSSLRAASKRFGEIVAAGRRRGRWRARHRRRASALMPFSAVGTGTAITPARQPGEIAQEAGAILGRQHADDQHQRPRHALLQIGKRGGDGAAAVRIVPAVEPQFAARRRRAPRAGPAPAAACAPASRPWSCRLRRPPAQSSASDRAQRGDREPGILELMAAVKLRRRQIEQARLVLIDQPAALFGRGPVLAGDLQAARRALPPAARSRRARRAAARRRSRARRA